MVIKVERNHFFFVLLYYSLILHYVLCWKSIITVIWDAAHFNSTVINHNDYETLSNIVVVVSDFLSESHYTIGHSFQNA